LAHREARIALTAMQPRSPLEGTVVASVRHLSIPFTPEKHTPEPS